MGLCRTVRHWLDRVWLAWGLIIVRWMGDMILKLMIRGVIVVTGMRDKMVRSRADITWVPAVVRRLVSASRLMVIGELR